MSGLRGTSRLPRACPLLSYPLHNALLCKGFFLVNCPQSATLFDPKPSSEVKEGGDRRGSNPLKRGLIISEIMACFRGYQRYNGSEIRDG